MQSCSHAWLATTQSHCCTTGQEDAAASSIAHATTVMYSRQLLSCRTPIVCAPGHLLVVVAENVVPLEVLDVRRGFRLQQAQQSAPFLAEGMRQASSDSTSHARDRWPPSPIGSGSDLILRCQLRMGSCKHTALRLWLSREHVQRQRTQSRTSCLRAPTQSECHAPGSRHEHATHNSHLPCPE